ncbi:extracellular solute-binding protein [Agilicoccus flavus]|uniref:extracellular solute-binding protein n=1 Tax=Agilicoccus flavus TaxID=2775968 RepID=UPI001CF60DDB|nr:extracellular solute-binding protein [Agilicoccus flavus]
MMRTRMAVVGAVTATTLALAACGGGAQPSGPAGATGGGGGGQAGANGFSAWVLTGATQTTMKNSLEQWTQAHADAPATAEYFANDSYKEKIRTAVGSGNAPTLIWSWAGGTLKDYVKNKNVVDLTASTKTLQDRIVPSVMETGKVDGKVYAVPNNNAQPVLMYTNKEVLSKAGINAAPKTYAELLDQVQKLKSAGVDTPIALAGQSLWPELMWIEYLVDRQAGDQLFKKIANGDPSAWDDPAMIDGLTKIQELVKAGAFGDKYGSVTADSGADAALIHTGRSAMMLQGAWVYGTFLTDAPDFVKAGKLGWAPFPTIDGGKGDPSNVYGNPSNFWSVSASATPAQQQAAIKYLNEGMFNDNYLNDLVAGGMVPVTSDAQSKFTGEQKEFLTYAFDMTKNAKNFQLSWDQALSPAQSQAILQNLGQIFLNQITPQQFVSAVKAVK